MGGDLAAGFADYHYRWQLPDTAPLHSDFPEWAGDDLAGRRLLVHAEQGLGDTLQFARYLPMLRDRAGGDAGEIIFETQPELARLLEGNALAGGGGEPDRCTR